MCEESGGSLIAPCRISLTCKSFVTTGALWNKVTTLYINDLRLVGHLKKYHEGLRRVYSEGRDSRRKALSLAKKLAPQITHFVLGNAKSEEVILIVARLNPQIVEVLDISCKLDSPAFLEDFLDGGCPRLRAFKVGMPFGELDVRRILKLLANVTTLETLLLDTGTFDSLRDFAPGLTAICAANPRLTRIMFEDGADMARARLFDERLVAEKKWHEINEQAKVRYGIGLSQFGCRKYVASRDGFLPYLLRSVPENSQPSIFTDYKDLYALSWSSEAVKADPELAAGELGALLGYKKLYSVKEVKWIVKRLNMLMKAHRSNPPLGEFTPWSQHGVHKELSTCVENAIGDYAAVPASQGMEEPMRLLVALVQKWQKRDPGCLSWLTYRPYVPSSAPRRSDPASFAWLRNAVKSNG